MNILKLSFFLILFFHAFDGVSAKWYPLPFPIDKNGILLLPQKFEYTLYPNDILKIGNLEINFTKISAKFIRSNASSDYKLEFNWPKNLISEGQIIIKSNIGHPILSFSFKESKQSSDVESFVSDEISEEKLTEIRNATFFNICVYSNIEQSRIFLCSGNYLLENTNSETEIKTTLRPTEATASTVEVNGKIVGNQGIIFLSNSAETISFRTQLKNSSALEIETRRKDIEFHDIIYDNKTEKIHLIVAGSEPIDKLSSTLIENNKWLIKIPKNQTSIYFYGEANIPMRQELFINGSIPEQKDRVFSNHNLSNTYKTYSSSVKFRLKSSKDSKLNPHDPSDQIEPSKNRFYWTANQLEKGSINQKLVQVERNNNIYLASFKIERGYPFEIDLVGSYLLPKQNPYALAEFKWWMDQFPTYLRWGLGISHSHHLFNKADNINIDSNTFELFYKWNPQFSLTKNFFMISLFYENILVQTEQQNQIGLGLTYQNFSPQFIHLFSTWYEIKLKFMLNKLATDIDFTHPLYFKITSLLKMKEQFLFQYGLEINSYNSSTYTISNEFGPHLGIKFVF